MNAAAKTWSAITNANGSSPRRLSRRGRTSRCFLGTGRCARPSRPTPRRRLTSSAWRATGSPWWPVTTTTSTKPASLAAMIERFEKAQPTESYKRLVGPSAPKPRSETGGQHHNPRRARVVIDVRRDDVSVERRRNLGRLGG